MAFNISTIVASGIVVGGLAIGTITFTESQGLTNIRDTAQDFRDKIFNLDSSVNNWKTAFNDLKLEATTKITDANTKIAQKLSEIEGLQTTISELETNISELTAQVASGEGNADVLTQEIERLNSELTKANTEVQALQSEMDAMSAEVGTVGDTVEVAPDASLPNVLDAETPATPETIAPEEEPVVEPEPVVTPPATPVYDLSYLSTTQKNTLTAMGINNISNVTKTNTNTLNIYADAGFNYQASGVYNNTSTFKSSVIPTMNTKVGITDTYLQKVVIRTHDGTIVKTFDTVSNGWN